MITIKNILNSIIACALALLTGNAFAQDVVFSAAASAQKMGIQDQIQVQYVIKNAPELKSLGPKQEIQNDFSIVGGPFSSQSMNMSTVNGRTTMSKSLTITYVLQPKRKGTLRIPEAVAVDEEDHTYESNGINVEVVDGSLAQQQQQQRRRSRDPWGDDPFEALLRQRQRQMQAMQQRRQQQMQQRQQQNPSTAPTTEANLGKDLYIKVEVDKSKVYVGEQITASYKLYARLPMNVNISKLPSLNGFWTQDFDMPNGKITPVEKVIDGKRYQVFTLKKSALFPQQDGTLELDPAEAEGIARVMEKSNRRDPFFDDPFFSSFFMDDPFSDEFFGGYSYKNVKVNLKSKPVKITVLPLPEEGKPENYTGAVGNFTASSSIDKTEITTDDVANLKFVIKGSGNIKLIEPPTLNLPNGLVAYDPIIEDTITGRTTTITGSKTITYSITPRTPGTYDIAPIKFTYFNAKTAKYETITTEPIKLTVKPGENYVADIPSNTLTDIHSISTTPLKALSFNSKPMVFSVGYWGMFALPLVAFVGVVLYKRREDQLAKDTVSLKMKRANKIALKRLTTANKLLQKNERVPFYEEISKAIWLYLSDKLNIPLASLSKDNVWDALNTRAINKDLQQDLNKVITECETALYAGVSGSQQMQQTYTDTVSIISKLEQSFKG